MLLLFGGLLPSPISSHPSYYAAAPPEAHHPLGLHSGATCALCFCCRTHLPAPSWSLFWFLQRAFAALQASSPFRVVSPPHHSNFPPQAQQTSNWSWVPTLQASSTPASSKTMGPGRQKWIFFYMFCWTGATVLSRTKALPGRSWRPLLAFFWATPRGVPAHHIDSATTEGGSI